MLLTSKNPDSLSKSFLLYVLNPHFSQMSFRITFSKCKVLMGPIFSEKVDKIMWILKKVKILSKFRLWYMCMQIYSPLLVQVRYIFLISAMTISK